VDLVIAPVSLGEVFDAADQFAAHDGIVRVVARVGEDDGDAPVGHVRVFVRHFVLPSVSHCLRHLMYSSLNGACQVIPSGRVGGARLP
jgi:hypothetical protein